MKVAIQGIKGSFHHQAVANYFGLAEFELVECANFKAVFEAVKNGQAEMACIAIENSIYGSLYENYDLINSYGFPIVGEIFLKITHNLIVLPTVNDVSEIKNVFSHPVAIAQCTKFLSQHDFNIVNKEDTAKSVQEVHDLELKDTAAIASTQAAELFQMKILVPGIQDHPNNYTRFLFLNNSQLTTNNLQDKLPENVKVSLNFQISNQPGSLLTTLNIIAEYKGNMSKIESRPIPGQVWQYQFYVDIVIDPLNVEPMIQAVDEATEEFKVLGRYSEGRYAE